jgi:hypothetical protein
MEAFVEHISRYLFVGQDINVFAVLDGASIPELRSTLHQLQPPHACLYRGDLEPDIAQVAPYVVELDPDSDFTDQLVLDGWGKHWGIFLRSTADLNSVRRHLRGLLIVNDPDAKPMLFRYYDPRVLRKFLPTCTPDQLETFFGPADSFLLENEDGTELLRFRMVNGGLKKEKRQFTTIEQEDLAHDRAERELHRRQLQPTPAERELTEEDMQQSLVNFWTTMHGVKLPKERSEEDPED